MQHNKLTVWLQITFLILACVNEYNEFKSPNYVNYVHVYIVSCSKFPYWFLIGTFLELVSELETEGKLKKHINSNHKGIFMFMSAKGDDLCWTSTHSSHCLRIHSINFFQAILESIKTLYQLWYLQKLMRYLRLQQILATLVFLIFTHPISRP